MPKDKTTTKSSTKPAVDEEKAIGSAPELPQELARELHKTTKSASKPKKASPAKTSSETPIVQPEAGVASVDKPIQTDEESPLLANSDTDRAVEDIVAHESDELLAVEDAMLDQAKREAAPRSGGRLRRFFAAWWHNPWARWGTAVASLALMATIAIIPGSRYYTLNTLGVRSSASLIVLDDTTQLPLKNVTVTLGDKRSQTNINGSVRFTDLRLGSYDLEVERIAFAPKASRVTIGWGSNPLGTYALKAVGRQYTIHLVDYLSGKPVLAAEATENDASALSDKNGKIVLTREDTDLHDVEVNLSAAGYRSETLTLKADSTATPKVSLVPSRKAVFISKQSGKYDLFAMDLDGKNKKLLLAGTGRENNNIALAVNADGTQVALVSTRDDKRDRDGFPLSALTLVSTGSGATQTLEHAEQVQLIDWIDNRIVYQATASGASASNPQRYRLLSFDFATNSRTQIAAANQFNAVISAEGQLYYANSSTEPKAQLGLFKVRANGTGRQRVLDQEVWSGFRVSPTTLNLQTPDGWYSYSLKSGSSSKMAAPANYKNHLYVANANGGKSAWVDSRDGKGTLIVYDNGTGKDTVLQAQDGLALPVRWLNDHVLVYRVVNGQETGDYAVSIDGGSAKKVADVTNTYGFAQAY